MSERVYKIQIPEGVPSYVSDSVQAQCNQAFNAAFTYKTEELKAAVMQRVLQEIDILRRHADGNGCGSHPAWITWGYRTITEAWQDAARLAAFRDAIHADDFSHVTNGHQVSVDAFHVYRRDPSSPSGCVLVVSANKDLQGLKEVMNGINTCAGGERGKMASRL